MDARWIPVVSAGVGVLGGLGGTLIGAYVANQGQDRRLDRERRDAIRDVHREAFANYLGATEEYVIDNLAGAPEPTKREALVRIFVARARVFIVAPKLTKAAEDVTNVLITDDYQQKKDEVGCDDACENLVDKTQEQDYEKAGNRFLRKAVHEIAETRK
jgi:hypothetical protein